MPEIILPGEGKKSGPNVSLPVPPTDSLEYAKKVIGENAVDSRGRPVQFDSTNAQEASKRKNLVPAVKYLRGYITKYKAALDSEYERRKSENPDYPGLTDMEIKEIVGEDGSRYLDAVDLFTKYRQMTNKGGSAFEEDQLDRITYNPSSLDGSGRSTTVRYYSPGKGASSLTPGAKLKGATNMIPRIATVR